MVDDFCFTLYPGLLNNDTVIGDPLFTVPLYDRSGSTPGSLPPALCFEIHGAANRTFNLVSDMCTSVNAQYAPMNIPENGNIIDAIGIRAVNSLGWCLDVGVSLASNCTPVVSEGNRTFSTSRYRSGGISVSKYRDRVRISVPNCENVQLVMWVECEEVRGQKMVKFIISRGVNLRPTSHGLLGKYSDMSIVLAGCCLLVSYPDPTLS